MTECGPQTTLQDRLVAEGVRSLEEARGAPFADPEAEAAARACSGDLERRVVVRARCLSQSPEMLTGLRRLQSALRLLSVAGVLAAAFAGMATATGVLGATSGDAVNVFLVLGALLGAHLLMLSVWLALLAWRPHGGGGGLLGRLVWDLARRATRRLYGDSGQVAAIKALAGLAARGSAGRWAMGALSHGFWLAFLTSAALMVVILLGTRQYAFIWETTILSEESYVPLTSALEWLPEQLGFPVPSPSQVRASQWSGSGPPPYELAEPWSGLLVGSLVVYGVLPRLLLLLFCVVMARRAMRAWRLDTTLPGYAVVAARLQPAVMSLGVTDPAPAELPAGEVDRAAAGSWGSFAGDGPVAVLGLEIEQPATGWPPQLPGRSWVDLGLVDSREDRQRVLQQLAAEGGSARATMAVCSLAATPDRGAERFLAALNKDVDGRLALLLTDGQRLRKRGPSGSQATARRVAAWHELARRCLIPEQHIIEVDLEHLTAASSTRAAAFLGGAPIGQGRNNDSRIERAFTLIVTRLRQHSSQSGSACQSQTQSQSFGAWADAGQAELHRKIAELYADRGNAWQRVLRHVREGEMPLTERMDLSAERFMGLLPTTLRARTDWLVPGAVAGAMACVAAAALVSPAAIAALPMWAGVGGVVAAVVRGKLTGGAGRHHAEVAGGELTVSVRAAALFALLLELQGRGEAQIAEMLGRVIPEEAQPLDSLDEARAWLDQVAARLQSALKSEPVCEQRP